MSDLFLTGGLTRIEVCAACNTQQATHQANCVFWPWSRGWTIGKSPTTEDICGFVSKELRFSVELFNTYNKVKISGWLLVVDSCS